MPIEPLDFYRFAINLYESHESEIDSRVIIGRAYYSAFLYARDSAGLSSKGSNGHQQVINYYKNLKDPTSRYVANAIDNLRAYRQDSDYEMSKIIPLKDVGSALSTSKKILETLGCKVD
ncbi:MAG: hypothetical protein Q7U84_00750 [Polynucleobacter sp.]|jgi:hypothetical protein|nr:hypothetical protein [Polynucleobacter sp.]OZB49377.1 MAG: hypothetical protein B7X60_01315 [Polynucleobacter sp. 39-45-136]